MAVYVNSWTESISINRSRKTSSKGKERLRLSLSTEGISGRTDTIITDLKEILLGNLGL